MTIRVQDTFAGTNGDALNSHAPDIDVVGGGWASAGLRTTDTEGGGDIQSSQLRLANGSAGHVINAGVSDGVVSFDFIVGATNDNRGHAFLRYQQDGDLLFWNFRETEGDTTLYSIQADGASTSIATTTHTFAEGNTYGMRAVLSGTSIKLYIGEVLKIDTSSALFTTQTKFGLGIGGGTNTNLRFDNFVFKDFGESVPVATLRLTGVAPTDNRTGIWRESVPVSALRLTSFAPIVYHSNPLDEEGVRVYDTFTDADGTALNSHVPTIDTVGGGWSSIKLNSSDPTTGGGDIQGNALRLSTASGGHVINAGIADAIVKCRYRPGLSNDSRANIVLRYQQNGDLLYVNIREDTDAVSLFSIQTNTQTQIATAGFTFAEQRGYYIRSVLTGSAIKVYVDGALTLNTSSALFTTQTRYGLSLGGGTNTNMRIDNFVVQGFNKSVPAAALRLAGFTPDTALTGIPFFPEEPRVQAGSAPPVRPRIVIVDNKRYRITSDGELLWLLNEFLKKQRRELASELSAEEKSKDRRTRIRLLKTSVTNTQKRVSQIDHQRVDEEDLLLLLADETLH